MSEVWVPAAGYPHYEVSSLGRVRSLYDGQSNRGGIMAQHFNKKRYLQVNLREGGINHTVRVNSLVCESFHGPRPTGMHAAHENGDRQDNCPENLSWKTPSDNVLDQVKHGTHNNASKTHCPAGHPLSGFNLYVYPDGGRECRICRSASSRARRARLMEVGR